MTLRINIVFSFLVLLIMCGCRGKQEVLKVLDNEEFFTSGLAEFSRKLTTRDVPAAERLISMWGIS